MLLTRSEFEGRKAKGTLRIALIGMSNIGKSHWTRDIVKRHDFKSYEVDEAIQKRLDVENIEQSAARMGQPYDKDYQNRAQEYLALEQEMTLDAENVPGNIILDTTGSVIYLPILTTNIIKNSYLTVYISANQKQIGTLIQRFTTTQKPLIWGEAYEQKSGLSRHESMMACYPFLLESRATLYKSMTDITVEAAGCALGNKDGFLGLIKTALPIAANRHP